MGQVCTEYTVHVNGRKVKARGVHSLSMYESVDRWCDCGLLLFRLQRLQRAASHLGVVLTDLGREQRGLLTHTHTHLLEGVSGG